MVSLAMIGGLIIALVLGFPIAYTLIAIGFGASLYLQGWGAAGFLMGNIPVSVGANFAYVIIPLFLLMGEVAFSAGLSERAFRFGKVALRRVPGGLAAASVLGCAGFSAVCGSSIVTSATIGRVAIPEMLKAGYSQKLAGASVAVAGTLGVMIPPSSILIIYGISTQTPIIPLFKAALIPGLLTLITYLIVIWAIVKTDKEAAPPQAVGVSGRGMKGLEEIKELVRAALAMWDAFLLFSLVIGSMIFGIATPTEAAAVGALSACLIAVYRKTRLAEFAGALRRAAASTASILLLIIGSAIFSLALAQTQVPQQIANFVGVLSFPPEVMLILILVPFLFLGMFLDAISMVLLTMPILFPVANQIGVDPILFGILVTKMTEIGNITPPVGLNVFAVKAAAPNLEIGNVFRGAVPFIIGEIVLVGVLIFYPGLTLFWL